MAPRENDPDEDHDGPSSDRPMTLGEHLDELRKRLLRAVMYAAVAAVVCFYFRQELMLLALGPGMWVAEKQELVFLATAPTELFFTTMKVVIVAALLFASPLILRELWLFVATGLYPQERKSIQVFAPVSYLLFIGGCAFGHFVLQPVMLLVLFTFDVEGLTEGGGVPLEVMPNFANLVSLYMGMSLIMGLLFQLPLVMLFAQWIGVVDWRVYSAYRRHFVMGAVILAAVLTPTGDAVSLGISMVPILLLFEAGIILCRTVQRKAEAEES